VFWADEIHPDHIAKNLFQRQSLFFIHGKQETGQHDKDHAERGCAGADMLLEQEKQRNADQRAAAEANKLKDTNPRRIPFRFSGCSQTVSAV